MQFKDVLGQESIKSHLLQEYHSNRISHAQMFLGPRGANKLPLAIAFSQLLLCEKPSEIDSCGQCESCKQVQTYSHPDLHFAYPVFGADKERQASHAERERKWLNNLKENPLFDYEGWSDIMEAGGKLLSLGRFEGDTISKKLSLKSFAGGYKIMIIWLQELMNATCANNLLKILEEPPPKTLFILISENTENSLPTIISRTQIINVPKLKEQDILKALEGKGIGNMEASEISRRANGDLLEAMEIVKGSQKKEIFLSQFIGLMRACYTKDVSKMLDWSESASKLGRDGLVDFLNYALYMTRQSLMRNYQAELTNYSTDEGQFLDKFARFINGNNVLKIYEELNQASYYIQRNCNPKIILTGLTFQVMRELHKA
ncbi:MAG: DNA polymerase III subunit delta' [Crocinitomicaceae bacterium]